MLCRAADRTSNTLLQSLCNYPRLLIQEGSILSFIITSRLLGFACCFYIILLKALELLVKFAALIISVSARLQFALSCNGFVEAVSQLLPASSRSFKPFVFLLERLEDRSIFLILRLIICQAIFLLRYCIFGLGNLLSELSKTLISWIFRFELCTICRKALAQWNSLHFFIEGSLQIISALLLLVESKLGLLKQQLDLLMLLNLAEIRINKLEIAFVFLN